MPINQKINSSVVTHQPSKQTFFYIVAKDHPFFDSLTNFSKINIIDDTLIMLDGQRMGNMGQFYKLGKETKYSSGIQKMINVLRSPVGPALASCLVVTIISGIRQDYLTLSLNTGVYVGLILLNLCASNIFPKNELLEYKKVFLVEIDYTKASDELKEFLEKFKLNIVDLQNHGELMKHFIGGYVKNRFGNFVDFAKFSNNNSNSSCLSSCFGSDVKGEEKNSKVSSADNTSSITDNVSSL
jgi:hypothetical protein